MDDPSMLYTHINADWARVPPGINGRTHGVCVARDGSVIVFAQTRDALLHFDAEGQLKARHGGDGWLAAHGLTYQVHDGRETLWLTDHTSGRVAKTTLTGEVIHELAPSRYVDLHDAGDGGRADHGYAPTCAIEDYESGTIWVADGYGQFVVHQYDRHGALIQTLNGVEGAGRFNCPHGLTLDETGRLWIADRGNRRIAIYDSQGRFIEAHEELCHSPCGFDYTRERIVVPELFGSLKLFDRDWNLVTEIGKHPDIRIDIDASGALQQQTPDGWPNVDPATIPASSFNSPHAACFGTNDEIYVVEWILGGRVSRIDPT